MVTTSLRYLVFTFTKVLNKAEPGYQKFLLYEDSNSKDVNSNPKRAEQDQIVRNISNMATRISVSPHVCFILV